MNSPKTRILIIEDNPDDQILLLRQIGTAGLREQVKIIADGEQALEYLAREARDLVALFLDLHLPRLGGLQVLERMRGYDHLLKLPVVVMTSSNDPSDLARCQHFGVVDYVAKPVSFASFSKAIANTFHSQAFRPQDD